MKFLTVITIFLALYSANAADLTTTKNEKAGFQISTPKNWESVDQKMMKEPIVLSLIQKQKESSIIVMATTDAKMTCKEFLTSMDQSRGTKNNLTVEKQIAPEITLKSSGASEAILGDYEIQGKGPGFPVRQKSICLKSKDQIRVVTAAYQKKKGAQYEPLLKEVFDSFKFLTAEKKTK